MMQWRARAPVRFCDLGGWTDTRIVPHGTVLNFTARMYTYVTLTVHEGPSGVTLESLDTEERCSFHDMRQVEYNGVLDLLKAAVARSGIEIRRHGAFSTHRQISLQVRSSAPPASGLGSSAALGVAAIGALVRYCGGHLLPHEIARESQLLEVENLKLECGVQDQLASAYGGVNFMEVEYPNARIFPIHLDPSVICELEDRFRADLHGQVAFLQRHASEGDCRGRPASRRLQRPGRRGRGRQGSTSGRRLWGLRHGHERQLGCPETTAPGDHHARDGSAP